MFSKLSGVLNLECCARYIFDSETNFNATKQLNCQIPSNYKNW